ncbi:MAG: carbon storage regulator CsrA [Gemmatimonadaceae bacterium]|nr:carbon storage regulator CsrA [Gemmatimonadaceae bacterium]
MLILSRKAGDAIVIDGGIRIVVVQCERGTVRIGIEAPAEVTILRAELLEQVAAQNRRASVSSDVPAALVASGGALAPRRVAAATD